MANEISTAGILIKYAAESTAGTRPTTGYTECPDIFTGISGLGAEYDKYDVTTLKETKRHRFVKGLQNNDGNISLSCNINPSARSAWNTIVSTYTALTGGKGMWFEFTLPGDSESYYIKGEPLPMGFPDVEVAQACQGAVQIIEAESAEFATKST